MLALDLLPPLHSCKYVLRLYRPTAFIVPTCAYSCCRPLRHIITWVVPAARPISQYCSFSYMCRVVLDSLAFCRPVSFVLRCTTEQRSWSCRPESHCQCLRSPMIPRGLLAPFGRGPSPLARSVDRPCLPTPNARVHLINSTLPLHATTTLPSDVHYLHPSHSCFLNVL